MTTVFIITEYRSESAYIVAVMPGTSTKEQIAAVIAQASQTRVLGTYESSYYDYEEHSVVYPT
jgi:hypothetical protein